MLRKSFRLHGPRHGPYVDPRSGLISASAFSVRYIDSCLCPNFSRTVPVLRYGIAYSGKICAVVSKHFTERGMSPFLANCSPSKIHDLIEFGSHSIAWSNELHGSVEQEEPYKCGR